MATANDGMVVCDVCHGLFWPGDPAAVVELWPEWRHDPGFHVCLGCLRRAYAERYLADIAAIDALYRERQAVVTGPQRAAPRPPRPSLAGPQLSPCPQQEGSPMNAAEMAAYVVEGAERLTGPQLPVAGAREIFEGFIARFGPLDAARVARAAIEGAQGHVGGRPRHAQALPAQPRRVLRQDHPRRAGRPGPG
jgi:hypothetical protein